MKARRRKLFAALGLAAVVGLGYGAIGSGGTVFTAEQEVKAQQFKQYDAEMAALALAAPQNWTQQQWRLACAGLQLGVATWKTAELRHSAGQIDELAVQWSGWLRPLTATQYSARRFHFAGLVATEANWRDNENLLSERWLMRDGGRVGAWRRDVSLLAGLRHAEAQGDLPSLPFAPTLNGLADASDVGLLWRLRHYTGAVGSSAPWWLLRLPQVRGGTIARLPDSAPAGGGAPMTHLLLTIEQPQVVVALWLQKRAPFAIVQADVSLAHVTCTAVLAEAER